MTVRVALPASHPMAGKLRKGDSVIMRGRVGDDGECEMHTVEKVRTNGHAPRIDPIAYLKSKQKGAKLK